MSKEKDVKKLLDEITNAKEPPALVLVIVPDIVRRNRLIEAVLQNMKKVGPITSPRRAIGRELSVDACARLVDELNAPSLFSPWQTVIIDRVDELSGKVTPHLSKIMKNLPPQVTLILTAADLASNSVVLKSANEAGIVITLDELRGAPLNRWIERELTRAGIKDFSPAIIAQLDSIAEGDPDRLSQLIEITSLYSDGERVTESHIAKLFEESPDPNEFQLFELLQRGQAAAAERLLAELIAQGKNAFLLLGLIGKTYTSYLTMRNLLESGVQAEEIRIKLGSKPWVFNKQIAAVRSYSQDRLVACLEAVINADSKLKNKSLGEELVLGELLHALAA